MTVDLLSYVGLKVSHCSVTFSTFDPVMANKTIYIEAVKTPGTFSRVAEINYSGVKPSEPGSGWDNYTPLSNQVCSVHRHHYHRHHHHWPYVVWIGHIHYLKQEAQMSQIDRAMLRVIEYFAKSLKITQGHSK